MEQHLIRDTLIFRQVPDYEFFDESNTLIK